MRKNFTLFCLCMLASMTGTTAWALAPNGDGVYEIGTAADLVEFSALVGGGSTDVNAVLTADIDMTGIENYVPIGSASHYYHGTFDGQGHRILNLKVKGEQFCGVFGIVTGGAVIKNFILDASSSIEGVEDAGIVGATRGAGKVTLQCLGNEADITIKGTNAGAILSDNEDTQATIYIERCFNTGTIQSAGKSAAICGWIGLGGTIYDTYSIATVEGVEGDDKCFTRKKGSVDIVNCYCDFGTQVAVVSKADAASGRLAWLLNGGTFVNPKFFQTLGVDMHPLPFASSQVVYMHGKAYGSFDPADASSFADARSNMAFAETSYAEEAIANKQITDSYIALLNTWETMTDYEAFCTSYVNAQALRAQLDASIAAYAKYDDLCQYIIGYLLENTFENEARNTLEAYLMDTTEPGTFPKGSYPYILENRQLTDADIAAEMEYVSQLFNAAIADSFVAGTEITKMLKNPNFKEQWEGWNLETNAFTAMAIGGDASVMTIARGYNNTFSLEQTIKGLPNGVYMVDVNALMRCANDDACGFYAGEITLNGNVNYVQTVSEDPLPMSSAKDGENCYTASDRTVSLNGAQCYIPSDMIGCSYAFNSGRYENYVVVEVTDNTLTVGIRCLGTGQIKDWLPFGDFRLFFLGQAEDSPEQMSKALNGYVARAKFISAVEPSATEFATAPNFSAALKTQLAELLTESETAESGAQKLSLINRFSQLFEDIYASRKAYVELARLGSTVTDFAGELLTMQQISSEEYAQVTQDAGAALDAYTNGSMTTEEALALASQMNSDYISPYIPYADGWYLISTPVQLQYLFIMINSGAANVNAKLMDDIDFTAYNMNLKKFSGVLDGQGHTITINRTGSADEGDAALCYELVGTFQNLGLAGTITANSKNVASFSSYHYGTLSRCVSTVTILPTFGGDITGGGLIARGQTGGRVEDCLFAGKIDRSDAIKAGGICGWLSGNTEFDNCMAIGELAIQIDNTSYAIARNSNKKGTLTNCYYLEGFGGRIDEGAIAVTPAQLKSGELAYTLGWGQELGKDDYPSPICPKTVYRNDDGTYYNEQEIVEPTVPVADLLDVVFHEDGTAEDVSPMHNSVTRIGETSSVYYSEALQRYVACFGNPYGSNCTGFYQTSNYEAADNAIHKALADGHTLEVLCAASYEGNIPNAEAKPFSAMQGGGTGFLICKTNAAGSGGKNVFTFLPNVTTSGSSTWQWATSGVVPEALQFYHVVGVWNKEEQKTYIYVNGELKNTLDSPGEFRFANEGCNWFAIGGDPANASSAHGSWCGDVAIARAYDKPLTAEEVALLWNELPSELPTGIHAVSQETVPFGIFRLDGVRVEKPGQGIYVIDGRKVLVK